MPAVALTIAGSDPSGGAGIQADLKTFHQFGVYGEAVITLLTVQNTLSVERVECMTADLVIQQLRAVLADIPPAAAKTGALGSKAIVEAIASAAEDFAFPLVVDPVMIGKQGASLMADDARSSMLERLIARAFLVTPNLPEASALTGIEIHDLDGMRRAAIHIAGAGAKAVLIKGGHLTGPATDVLYFEGAFHEFPAPRIATSHTHGTGCVYSAAITAELARGALLPVAIARAKTFITEAIRTNPGLGHGSGPVNHHARLAASGETAL